MTVRASRRRHFTTADAGWGHGLGRGGIRASIVFAVSIRCRYLRSPGGVTIYGI